ncbi:predicted protein [Sclerotinia sclerotiorum 1980 UF-70]|uniref:C2H2-type domain-containing protein n=1 Tax=Sclerotinia sclerotiorum (strain ATCC 18683 / 1980 / Ss-1) TaxID=665079 RepID=A7EIP3_SCLS1|nr:predicted protein [Sclerotinia sclerotiorum 1980 UF-70]EDO02709.1 predicted protein [Sclerotinia sclerotiorum 1980 UF-70]
MGVSESHYAKSLGESYYPQPTPIDDPTQKDLLGASTAYNATFCSYQTHGTQCFLEHGGNGFEPNQARLDGSYADARMAQYMRDLNIDPLCNSFYRGDESEILRSALLEGNKHLDTVIPKADTLAKGGDITLTSVQDTEIEYGFEISSAFAPPWSAEDIRGQHQWRKGNLVRHKKETHNMKSEDRFMCDIKDCKETFTRISNLNVHQGNKHGFPVSRKTRNRRSSVPGIINKPKAGRRTTKAPKTVALADIPERSRSQSVPGLFGLF